MAKKMKKTFAMFLVMSMMASMFSVPALAADETVVETEQIVEGELVTDMTTTTTTTTDENGNTTVTVTIEKETTNEEGLLVEISKVEEGSETTVETVPAEDVEVEVFEDGEPVEDASGSAGTAGSEVTGDLKEGEDDAEYDQTTVTTTEREVEVEVENVTVSTGDPVYVDKDGNEVGRTDEGFNYYWSDIYDVNLKSLFDGKASSWKTGSVVGYVVNEDGSKYVIHEQEGVCQRVIGHDNGTPEDRSDDYELSGQYCVDASTSATYWGKYRRANLEDADYYNEEDIAHLRAIMTYGYTWDDDDDQGMTNLANMKAMLKDAQENGDEATKELLKDMDIDNLTREQAATATGMAVWTYGNRFVLEDGQRIEYVSKDKSNEIANRIETLYKYLLTLKEEAPEETQIINQEKFIDDLDMTVGGKVEGKEANSDADDTNDVYNVEVKFSLVVQPAATGDDLIVKVVDSEGKVVKTARIAGEQKEGESFGYAKTEVDENGKVFYVLEDLELAENANTSFNLKLEGAQLLKEGVYIYEAQELTAEEYAERQIEYYKETNSLENMVSKFGSMEALREYHISSYNDNPNRGRSQNFIGKYSGTAEINVGMQIDLSFNVEEGTVTTEHIWRSEETVEIVPENPVVFAVPARPLNNIPDEEVPLADAPQTGDEAIAFAVLTVLAGFGLAAMHVSEQKRKAEEV